MSNQHLFELINAAAGLSGWQLFVARALADGLVYLLPLGLGWAWVRGNHSSRRELLQMLMSVGIALALGNAVTHLWPQARPFAMHLGNQYLAHSADPGLPSDHITVFWSLALAALTTRRFDLWALPLLTAGLVVGWSRVYLGVHFPFDILAALPVAMSGVAIAHALRRMSLPVVARILHCYHRLEKKLRSPVPPTHEA